MEIKFMYNFFRFLKFLLKVSVTHQMETLATTKAETIAPITVASTMSQTTASTGQTAKSIEGQAEEVHKHFNKTFL